MELYGSTVVSNTYPKIALFCVSVVALGLIVVNLKTYQMFSRFKPLVIRINDIGRAEAVNYVALESQPRDAEIRYFLMQFGSRPYGRMRATVRENYARSLFFLDGRLADATIEANKKNRTLESFLAGDGPQIEVVVKKIAIEDMRGTPYKETAG